MDEIDWQVLLNTAADCSCDYRGEPSWRRLIDHIASGKLTVVDRPNKRIQAFQEKMRKPIREQRHQEQSINWKAQAKRDRLRQEQKRRAAGIPPRGTQEELEKATGWRDASERLIEPQQQKILRY